MGITRGPKIIRNGLVLALDAADKNSYIGSGTTWRDMSGNNYNGQLINGPVFNGSNGGSFVFDGTNKYVDMPNTEGVFNFKNTAFTVSVWFKIPTNSALEPVIIKNRNSNDGWLIRFYYASLTDIRIVTVLNSFASGSTFQYSGRSAPFSIELNKWINLVVVITSDTANEAGNSIVHYINCIESIGLAGSGVPYQGGNPLCKLSLASEQFIGNISLAHIYSRGLTKAEIIQNYNALKSRFGL